MKTLIILLALFGGQVHAGLVTKPVVSLDEGSHRCWTGRDYLTCSYNNHEAVIRDIKQPLTVVAGDSFECVLTVDRVRCFVQATYHPLDIREIEVPLLKNPRQITGGGDNVCALDDFGMHCWAYPIYNSFPVTKPVLIKTPELKNPRMISAGTSQFCAIDDDGPKCWIDLQPRIEDSKLKALRERFRNATRIASGLSRVCIGDDSAIACSDDTPIEVAMQNEPHIKRDLEAFIQRPVVDKNHPAFNLDQIDYLTDLLTGIVTPAPARFFSAVSDTALKRPLDFKTASESRYLMLKLMEPAIQTNTSSYFATKFLPAFNASLNSIEQELGVQNIARIPRNDKNREAALRIMHSAFTVLLDFTPVEEKQSYVQLPRLIGQAILNQQNVPALTSALDQAMPQMQTLEQNRRAAFLVQIIRLAAEWLKGI